MADTSGAVGFAGFWGSFAILLGLAATWLQRRTTARWKAEDARQEQAAIEVKRIASTRPPPSATEAELSAKRIEVARALLTIEDLNAALSRLRRATDELERESQAKSAAVLAERARSEALASELEVLRRQIAGGIHGSTEPGRRSGSYGGDRSRVRAPDSGRFVAREALGPAVRDPDGGKTSG